MPSFWVCKTELGVGLFGKIKEISTQLAGVW